MLPIYIGYYTPNYSGEAIECAASLEEFDLRYELTPIESVGDWCANCAMKPQIILDAMDKYPETPIVYIDVDARIRKRPKLFEGHTPMKAVGCHVRPPGELLSGTLYFSPGWVSRAMVSVWRDRCKANPKVWDQATLHEVLGIFRHDLVMQIPPSYIAIFDDPKMCKPGDRVIEHMQASRRLA